MTEAIRPIVILFATTVIETSDRFLEATARKAATRGFKVDLITSAPKADECERPYRNVITTTWGRGFDSLFGTAKSLIQVRRLMKSGQYALVHTHTPTASAVVRLAKSTLPKRVRPIVIYTAHGFHFGEGLDGASNQVAEVVERYLLKWTDVLMVINDQDELWARRNAKSGTRVVRSRGVGIKEHFFDVQLTAESRKATRARMRIPDESFVALCVGELNANKRQTLAMDAVAKLKGERMLLILGKGHCLEPLKKRAKHLMERHLGLTIRFEGHQTDIVPYFTASDCLIHTSRREGHPIVIIEAMAVGLPVVAFPIRGCVDSLKDGRGFLIRGDDADAASIQLATVAMRSASTSHVVQSARVYARSFKRGRVAEQTVHVYESLIASHRPGYEL